MHDPTDSKGPRLNVMARLGMTPKMAAAYKRLARESQALHWIAVIIVIIIVLFVFVMLRHL